MNNARLATSVLASALARRAEAEGGFAVILAKGDANAGALLVILLERGANPRVFERTLQEDGCYAWSESGQKAAENDDTLRKFLARRREFDPDLWILELDIPFAERFAAEMNALD